MKKIIVVFIFLCVNSFIYASVFDSFTAKIDVDRANRLLNKGDYDGAVTLYEKALSKVTNSSELYYDMALGLYSKGENDSALEFLNMAKKTFNDNTSKKIKNSVYYNSGIMSIDKKDYRSAINELIEALVNNPKDINAKRALEYARKRLKEETGGQGGNDMEENPNNENNQNNENKSQGEGNENNSKEGQNEGLSDSDIERLLNSLRQLRKDNTPEDQYYSGGKIEKDW